MINATGSQGVFFHGSEVDGTSPSTIGKLSGAVSEHLIELIFYDPLLTAGGA
jgi:hypothetical protein